MMIEISYQSEDSDISVHQTKKELKEEQRRVIQYLKELIEYDFHQTFKVKIKGHKEI